MSNFKKRFASLNKKADANAVQKANAIKEIMEYISNNYDALLEDVPESELSQEEKDASYEAWRQITDIAISNNITDDEYLALRRMVGLK